MEPSACPSNPQLSLPADSGQRAHCRRVAALALEVGRFSDLPIRLEPVLEMAALLHHAVDLADAPQLSHLACDVILGSRNAEWDLPRDFQFPLPPELIAVLALVGGHPEPDAPPALRLIAGMVRMCNLIDEQLEALPFERTHIDSILEGVRSLAACEGFDPALIDTFVALRDHKLVDRVGEGQLPVEARVTEEVLQSLARSGDFEVHELERVALRDSVLAVTVIRTANAALYSPAQRVGTVRQAITYIGTTAARNVILAAVLRPLFASVDHTQIWSHSVRMAQFCSALAEQTGAMEPEKASLVGLIHDIGALAICIFAPRSIEIYRRLAERGCPPTYIEQLLFGCDHGELGGQLLAKWGFPDDLREAVTFHHQPELSAENLAAVLYLSELWAGLDEDVPAISRIHSCTSRTGLSLETLACIRTREGPLGLFKTLE